MKSLLHFAAAAAFAANTVAGHYVFHQLTTGGTTYPPWTYIRRNSNPEWLQNGPVEDLSSTDLRCNVGGQSSNGTETITVRAGDQFTFHSDVTVYHAGPVALYMSKAPGAAADYDGSGQWFKIHEWGPTGSSWPLWGESVPQEIAMFISWFTAKPAALQIRTRPTSRAASPTVNISSGSSSWAFTTPAHRLRYGGTLIFSSRE